MSSQTIRSAPKRTKTAKASLAGCTIVAEGQEIFVPPSAYTLEGFRAWATSDDFPTRGRLSFLDKEIYVDMSPEKIETHNKVKTEVSRGIANLAVKHHLGEFYSDRTLITNVDAGLSTEPDAA